MPTHAREPHHLYPITVNLSQAERMICSDPVGQILEQRSRTSSDAPSRPARIRRAPERRRLIELRLPTRPSPKRLGTCACRTQHLLNNATNEDAKQASEWGASGPCRPAGRPAFRIMRFCTSPICSLGGCQPAGVKGKCAMQYGAHFETLRRITFAFFLRPISLPSLSAARCNHYSSLFLHISAK